ncbi:unnamed protein product [Thlaspi arvense]|uniref:Partial AB-hydrolase lipase domain-containing protein n=1 Tax=Thlaspi arvense TaxID=13288 RepID=A0AAU9RH55_THLAR|nr:unnamed protein product [Thlaspi arvense]
MISVVWVGWSVKTFTYEALNNIVRLINGVSALLLAILPGNNSILEGIHGWELRPTFRGPRFPRWMENGVSSFNQFIHELSVNSDASSGDGYSSGEEESDGNVPPLSPLSYSSRMSRASSLTKFDRHWTYWIICIFSWIMFPVKFLFGIPLFLYHASWPTVPTNTESYGLSSIKKAQSLKDNFIQRTTDRRRGIIEDLHLAIEICIESIFDIVHKVAHSVLSPSETFNALLGWFSSHRNIGKYNAAGELDASVSTSTLGDNDPASTEKKTTYQQSMNTDARTCRDVITELGCLCLLKKAYAHLKHTSDLPLAVQNHQLGLSWYPYEAIHVVTTDGYVLLLERIPRRDSCKVVYLQHGILDSSMG